MLKMYTQFLLCYSWQKTLHNFSDAELIKIFHIGDFFGIHQKNMRKLTRYLQKNIPEGAQEDGQPALVKISHYNNSVRSLYRDNVLKAKFQNIPIGLFEDNGFPLFCLDLSDQKLDSLHGIEYLAKKYAKVRIFEISLKRNELKRLDVKQLRKLFPFLHSVEAENNCIEELILPKQLSHFGLFLQSNAIKNLPDFKFSKYEGGGYIDLCNNPLSAMAKEKLACAAKPSIFDNPRIAPLFDKNLYAVRSNELIDKVKSCAISIAGTSAIMYGSSIVLLSTPTKEELIAFNALAVIMSMSLSSVWHTRDRYCDLYDSYKGKYVESKPKYDETSDEKKVMKFSHLFGNNKNGIKNFKSKINYNIFKMGSV